MLTSPWIYLLLFILLSCKQLINQSTLLSPEHHQNQKYPSSNSLYGEWHQAQLPLDLKISKDFTEEESLIIKNMATEWEEAALHQVKFFYPDFSKTLDPHYVMVTDYMDDEIGIYKSQNWFSNVSPSALAITQFFGHRVNAGTHYEYIELEHADIFLNTRDYSFSTSSPPRPGAYDLGSVILHEMGHLLGLPHENKTNLSIMAPYLGVSTQNHKTHAIDKQNLKKNYQLTPEMEGRWTERNQTLHEREGEWVHGVVELKADGTCQHRVL